MKPTAKKNQLCILLCTLLLATTPATFAQEFEILLYEGFEHGGQRPPGWSEQFVQGSRIWRYEDGGYAPTGAPTFRHPPNAYSGDYNALFQDESIGPKRRLITPAIDFRTAIKPTLVFWHAMDEWDQSTDELKVYYSITKDPYTWVQLEHYTTPLANWTKREITLPDAVKVQQCYIAFEGISNWGWGVCIDEVKIEERGLLPRTVETFALRQYSVTFPSGTNINPFSFIRAFVTGNSGEIPVNAINLSYTGTSINDISNVRLYHTRDSLFTIGTPITSNVTINNNDITINAPSFNLLTGDNYLWICFDIAPSASYGNTIDFTLNANSVQLGNTTFPTTNLNPIQFANIHTSVLVDDFTNTTGWARTGVWQIGQPIGGGTFDPNFAFHGSNVLATNLSGNYPPGIWSDNPQTATSSTIDAKYYQNLSVYYRRWLNIEYFDRTSVQLSNNGEVSWYNLFVSNSDILDRRYRAVTHNIASFATRKEDVKIKFSLDTTNQVTEYGGWNIDNFAVTGEFIHSDVGVKSKILPVQQCGLTSTETVRVVIKNYGGATVSVPFEVGYSLNGGASYTREWFSDGIDSEEEIEFTFATPANLSAPGLKNLVFRTFLEGDQDPSNNSYSENLYVFPTVAFPYQTSFETSTAFWYPSGFNSSWQWGTPSGTIINKASNGTRVWATGLSQNYKNNEYSYLESPCFNLTGSEYPVFSFDYIMQVEEEFDGMLVQYSVDGGHNWNTLPANANYSSNWYDTETVAALGASGWSQNKSNYVTAKTLLPNELIGLPSVKFRFLFASNTINTNEGVAVDMIRIYELPYDLGISELVSPDDACEIGNNVTLELRIMNFGFRPLPINTQIPIRVRVDNGPVRSETINYGGGSPLTQGSTYDFTTTNTFNLFSAGIHNIVAYTNLATDDSRLNDTLKTTVNVYGMPGYTLGPDIGTMEPDTIVLNAGQGYTSYTWYKFNDPNWDVLGGQTGYQYNVPENGWGYYKVLVQNSLGCTATDSLEIAQSDKDVGVSAIFNISNACTNPDPIYPEVNLKFFGFVPFDGVETLPIKLSMNGQVLLEEIVTPNENWGVEGRTDSTYVFSSPIDISQIGAYQIKVYTDLNNDLSRLNDTTKVTVNTWGVPFVNTFVRVKTTPLTYEEVLGDIITTRADTLVFKATPGFISYNWEQQIKGQSTWTPYGNSETFFLSGVSNNLVSAYYRVTAEADHGCGIDIDTVFVNAADLSITSIVSPVALFCETTEPTPLRITIRNVGFETYPIGTQIHINAQTPFGEQNETITLSQQLLNSQEILYTFPQLVQFPIGEHYMSFTIETDNDPNPNNDSRSILSTVNPSPWVTIEPDSLFRIFGPDETYTITPSYSEDVISYQWHDGFDDANYLIWGPPMYVKYKVIALNSYSCAASDSLIIISSDLEVTNIISPKNDCELDNDTPVTFTLFNNGNQPYTLGTQVNVTLKLDGALVANQAITLPTNLASKSSINLTLPQTLNLEGRENATVQIDVSTAIDEVYYDNNSQNKTVYALGYPTITLGDDRDVHAWEEILDPGYFEFYTWQDASTDRTFTATEDGTYHVTVLDFTGCEGYAEVTLTFYIDDIGILQVDEPNTGCNLTTAEPVSIVLKNYGTYTFPVGTIINVGFNHLSNNHSEQIILSQPFAPDDEFPITFSGTVNLSSAQVHVIEVWVEVENDMVESNNSISWEITSLPTPVVNFNLSNPHYTSQPFTLDAGAGFVSYLWHDGSTGQTFNVTEPGTYSVTVVDDNGCEGFGEIQVIFMRSELNITEIISPTEVQCFVNPIPVEVEFVNERNEVVAAGAQLKMRYQVGIATPIQETFTLTQNLDIGQTLTYKFSQNANLPANNNYNLSFRIDYLDMEGNLVEQTTTVNPSPTVNIGPDTLGVNEWPHTLIAGVGGVTYLWNTGETGPSITVFESGKYWLTVTNTFGCSASDTIYLYLTSIQEIPGTGSVVTVFPNPVKERLTLNIAPQKPGEYFIEMISPTGQRVYYKKVVSDAEFTREIDVSSYSAGLYLLRVAMDGKWVVVRIVIDK